MKKIDKQFTLSDSSLTTDSIRFLTSGYQIKEYARNPIGFYLSRRDSGVFVRWTDLQIDGDRVLGKPIVNESFPGAQGLIDSIEGGFLNAAQMGHYVVMETSNDPKLKLPGQKGPTVTKWFNRECSIMDIPNNINALAMYAKDGHQIKLKDLMSEAEREAEAVLYPEKPRQDKSVSKLLEEAYNEQLINATLLVKLKRDWQNNPDGLNDLLNDFRKRRMQGLQVRTWEELDRAGLLPELKRTNYLAFKYKFREKFGTEYTES